MTACGILQKLWAKTITEAFQAKGICAKFFDLKTNHYSDIMTEVLDSKYIAVGSPTLNNGMMQNVAASYVISKV